MSEPRKRRTYRTPTVVAPVKHGTVTGYRSGCRCDGCKSANREETARHREAARERGLPEGDPRHGTGGGYTYYGCRCALCAEWAVAARAARKAQGLPDGDPRHGATGYNAYGCRCDVCKAGMSTRQKEEKGPGRIVPLSDPEDRAHGTITGYDWHGCRCDRCLAAHQVAQTGHRVAAKEVGLPDPSDPRHGTLTGYGRGCRCEPCREVSRAYHRARRAARKTSPK